MKSLVVEDEFTCREVLQIRLSKYGPCVAAVDGLEALEAIEKAYAENDPYDLVCLDIMMPKLDGMETLKRIREREAQKGIGGLDGVKVIMTTTCDQSSDIFGAFKAGCEAYLVKPIEKEKLLYELDKLGLLSQSQPVS